MEKTWIDNDEQFHCHVRACRERGRGCHLYSLHPWFLGYACVFICMCALKNEKNEKHVSVDHFHMNE